jgi:predicted transposase YbfD/YdcC
LSHPKKVGSLPVKGNAEEVKQTNEIGMAIPLLDAIDLKDKTITADAMNTQRKLATYLVEQRGAHYHFTAKDNQPTLLADIELFFHDRGKPDFVDFTPPDHGRIETRSIWTTTELNGYLDFPYVGQAFVIKRESINKKTGEHTCELAHGITSLTPEQADAKCVLATNRGHWAIENSCHYILDWNFDEDRSRISTGHGPANVTRLRRFAIGAIKSKGVANVAQKMRQLTMSVRLVFDYLHMTQNTCRATVS